MFFCLIKDDISVHSTLSFSSTNYSFSEYVRKHNLHSNTLDYTKEDDTILFIDSYNHHFENTTKGDNTHTYTSLGHLDLSTSTTCTSCEWSNCSAPNGRAIYITIGINLTVKDYKFLSYVTSTVNDRAIYANYANTVYVQSSLL